MKHLFIFLLIVYVVGIFVSFIQFRDKKGDLDNIVASWFFAALWPIIFGYIGYVRLKDYLLEYSKRNTKYKDEVTIELVYSDFLGSSYVPSSNCPITRACKRHFKSDSIITGPDNVYVDMVKYRIVGGFLPDEYYEVEERMMANKNYVYTIKLIKHEAKS